MNKLTGIALFALLCAGCHAHRYDGYDRFPEPVVSDDVFVRVPQSDLDDVAKLRTEWNEKRDRVAIAEREVEQERQRREVAEAELRAAEAGEHAARKGREVALESEPSVRERELNVAEEKLETARKNVLEAQKQIAYREVHIDQLEADVRLARARADLAAARMELAKANAVRKQDRPEAQGIAVSEFEACVREHEARVAMAEVDADAWSRKVKIRQDALDARLEARAASDAGKP